MFQKDQQDIPNQNLEQLFEISPKVFETLQLQSSNKHVAQSIQINIQKNGQGCIKMTQKKILDIFRRNSEEQISQSLNAQNSISNFIFQENNLDSFDIIQGNLVKGIYFNQDIGSEILELGKDIKNQQIKNNFQIFCQFGKIVRTVIDVDLQIDEIFHRMYFQKYPISAIKTFLEPAFQKVSSVELFFEHLDKQTRNYLEVNFLIQQQKKIILSDYKQNILNSDLFQLTNKDKNILQTLSLNGFEKNIKQYIDLLQILKDQYHQFITIGQQTHLVTLAYLSYDRIIPLKVDFDQQFYNKSIFFDIIFKDQFFKGFMEFLQSLIENKNFINELNELKDQVDILKQTFQNLQPYNNDDDYQQEIDIKNYYSIKQESTKRNKKRKKKQNKFKSSELNKEQQEEQVITINQQEQKYKIEQEYEKNIQEQNNNKNYQNFDIELREFERRLNTKIANFKVRPNLTDDWVNKLKIKAQRFQKRSL